jgi:predicted transcriptional regulator
LASYTDRADYSEPPIAGSGVWENRGLLDIIDSILLTCEDGALKTHVMYRCNLNSKQIKTYLGFLLARGLVEKRQDDQQSSRLSYVTTTRGKKYVAAYRTLLRILYVDLGKEVRA